MGSKGKANGRRSNSRVDAHGDEHVRGLDGADHASRAARRTNALKIESNEQGFPVKTWKADVQRICQAFVPDGRCARRSEIAS